MVRYAIVLLLLCIAAPLPAQVVRGVVVDAESRAPLNGVFVVLVDSAGRMRGGVLTDVKGTYAIATSEPGRYHVRAERIGHVSTSSNEFELIKDGVETVNLRAAVAPIALAPIDVESEERCIKRPQTGQRTAQLWEEARKALTVAQWTEKQRGIQFESRSYVRDVDAKTLSVKNETQRHGISRARPYTSISADSLARHGYVRNEGGGAVFYGPDADVLLSESFLDHHCFHSVIGSGENAGRIGLVFQPAMHVKLPDVRGTLWLDSKTYELQHIDFTYVNVAREYRQRGAGGRTEFKRLSNGAWFVSRWYIRMPTVVGGRLQGYQPISLQEEGGEVVSIRDPQSTQQMTQDGTIQGFVYDSVNGRPLEGATVYLSGTVHRTVTDDRGQFELRNIPPGRYVITHAHVSFDSLPAFPLPQFIDVKPLDTAQAQLAVPNIRTLMARVCERPAESPDNDRTLFGFARDERGNALEGVRVAATFKRYKGAPALPGNSGSRFEQDTNIAMTRTDAAGYYRICNLPADTRIELVAGETGRKTMQEVVVSGLYRRADFTIPRP